MATREAPIRTGRADPQAERYYTLQDAIERATELPGGHIHEGPKDPKTGYPTCYDVDDDHTA